MYPREIYGRSGGKGPRKSGRWELGAKHYLLEGGKTGSKNVGAGQKGTEKSLNRNSYLIVMPST